VIEVIFNQGLVVTEVSAITPLIFKPIREIVTTFSRVVADIKVRVGVILAIHTNKAALEMIARIMGRGIQTSIIVTIGTTTEDNLSVTIEEHLDKITIRVNRAIIQIHLISSSINPLINLQIITHRSYRLQHTTGQKPIINFSIKVNQICRDLLLN
jgi:hypothetical protein